MTQRKTLPCWRQLAAWRPRARPRTAQQAGADMQVCLATPCANLRPASSISRLPAYAAVAAASYFQDRQII